MEKEILLRKLSLKKNIMKFLHENDELLEQLHKNESLPPIEDVVRFSELITPSSHAPRNWKPGFPLFGSHPPQPLFEEMRCGALGLYNSKMKIDSIHPNKKIRKEN